MALGGPACDNKGRTQDFKINNANKCYDVLQTYTNNISPAASVAHACAEVGLPSLNTCLWCPFSVMNSMIMYAKQYKNIVYKVEGITCIAGNKRG